jgi:hypothetical protein
MFRTVSRISYIFFARNGRPHGRTENSVSYMIILFLILSRVDARSTNPRLIAGILIKRSEVTRSRFTSRSQLIIVIFENNIESNVHIVGYVETALHSDSEPNCNTASSRYREEIMEFPRYGNLLYTWPPSDDVEKPMYLPINTFYEYCLIYSASRLHI